MDGPALGKLLVDANVPVLVLNACRSAHAEPPPQPDAAADDASDEAAGASPAATEPASIHDNVRVVVRRSRKGLPAIMRAVGFRTA